MPPQPSGPTSSSRRACLPLSQEHRSGGAAHSFIAAPSRERQRVPVNARVSGAQAHPVRRSRSAERRGRPLLHRRQGKTQAAEKRTDDGLPVHSLRSLLGDLATVTGNSMAMVGQPDATFTLYRQPRFQARAFQLLEVAVNNLSRLLMPRNAADGRL